MKPLIGTELKRFLRDYKRGNPLAYDLVGVLQSVEYPYNVGAMFRLVPHSRPYRLALLAPTPAVLGVFLWSSMGPYVILPTSAICGFLLPIAYIGWLVLNNSASYLGADRPEGGRRLGYNAAMLLCIATVLASVTYSTGVKLNWF